MKTIRLRDYGILPDTDITISLWKLFKENTRDTEFVFEDGDYYFTPHEEMRYDYRISNSEVMPYRVLGIWMKEMENCKLTGNGARLYYSGHMQAVTMDHCKNVTMQGFVIDWKKPLVAEGTAVGLGEYYIDMYVDPEVFPHRFTGSNIEFDVGNDEWYPLLQRNCLQYDKEHLCACRVYGNHFVPRSVESLGDNVYRMHCWEKTNGRPGNVFILRHNMRIHAGIFAEKCENVTVDDVIVHSCGGLGCLAQFCHDMTFNRLHFVPNTKAGRSVSSGRDDGFHLTNNSGTVTVSECTFLGLMDDPINIHSCCCPVESVVDDYTLKCRYGHEEARGFHYWAEKGDEITLIRRGNLEQLGKMTAAEYELLDIDTFLLRFSEPIPDDVKEIAESGKLTVDNYSHTAAFVCRGNRFGSSNARGMLISTPQSVLVENNYFASSGSPIVIPGDAMYWFESGPCHDVTIRNNVFTDVCLSAYYGDCEGIISISPQVPEPDINIPFHTNICITDNVFDTTDTPVLYAYSVKGLTFKNNRIFKSFSGPKWHSADCKIKLRYCVDADVSGNCWIGTFGFSNDIVLEGENVNIATK
ncbi:MAG: right-handed parallel beta-helix repeat-containing protein [Ruminococcaceae bacterium]|nr:right-handed parallel beta-helix repeat-containing protein [Oscillospiraceae bacterium]